MSNSDAILDRTKPIFEEVIPFRIDQNGQRNTDLTVRILNGITPSRARILSVELTDESDYFFHHSLLLTEGDFAALRDDQSLLVDFASFPDMLISLLRLISSETSSSSKEYSCVLTIRGDSSPGGMSLMSIVQTNHFKNLTHLSLQLRLATDTSLKRYLASRLSYTKELLNESNTSLAHSLDISKRLESLAESRLQELKTLKCEVEVNLNTLTSKHAIDLAEARAIAQSERADAESSFRRAHEVQVMRHESIAAEAQASEMKIRAELETLHGELSRTSQALQTALSSESTFRDESISKTEELQRLREANITSSLLETKNAKELTQLTTRCAVLEQQVVDQRELLTRSQAQAQQSELLRERLKEDVGIYKALYEKNQDKLERSVKEIEKGNEVISRLDESVRIKTDLLKQMQDRLAERERTVLSLQREIDTVRAAVERERESREASEAALELSRNHLKQARETVSSNEQVISWLNKELQEATNTISDMKQVRISSQHSSQLSSFINAANVASKRVAVPMANVSTSANLTNTSILSAPTVSSPLPPSSSFFSQSMTNNKSPALMEQLFPSKPSSSNSGTGIARENPYLAGTVPLAEMLHEMKASGFTLNATTILESKRNSNSISINNTSSGVPGGGR